MPHRWRLRTRELNTVEHTLVMGVVNVTPDSFSDGGRFLEPNAAVAHGIRLLDDGADLLDVGGQSTRPGSRPVPVAEELGRVVPVIEALSRLGAVVSVDTSRPEVAAAAIDAGAEAVNDVTGLQDPAMRALCAAAGVGVVVMHMRGTPETMQDDPRYVDVVAEVRAELTAAAAAAEAAGVERERIVVDPGIGFGKTVGHNLELLARLDELVADGRPVLVGTSRKSSLGRVLAAAGRPTRPEERDVATAATVALAVAAGAAVVRVHDAAAAFDAARVADAIVRARKDHRG